MAGSDDPGDTASVSSFGLDADIAPVTSQRTPARVGSQFESVVAAAQVGADWAWSLLYRSVAANVLGYLRARGADDPEDLLGEVLLQVARNIGTFTGDEDGFRSWVFVVAHHRLLEERRRRRRRPASPMASVPDAADSSAEEEAMAGLLSDEARRLLDALTPEQREVVLLRVFADLPLEEVARIVGRPVSAVKALQRRGYGRLRKQLTARGYGGGGTLP
jgi:RNA polymerase sigma-70 factor (ECF subfamily)